MSRVVRFRRTTFRSNTPTTPSRSTSYNEVTVSRGAGGQNRRGHRVRFRLTARTSDGLVLQLDNASCSGNTVANQPC